MPRVTQHTASGRGATYTCTGCREPITKGQRYYRWVRRIGPKAGYRRHVACGPPRPTELTSRKTAQVDEAVGDFSAPEVDFSPLDEWNLEGAPDSVELDTSPWEDAVSEIADVAESVADEYEDGVSNMPDSLQDSPVAEASQDVADRLREWAESLREESSTEITVDLPEREGMTDDEWRQAAEEAIQSAWDDHGSELDSLMSDVPGYEG